MTLEIRSLPASEAGLALEWARAEGWNPGLDDAGAFFAPDPDGFLVGEVDSRPVCLVSAVRYDKTYGFLGFYICAPAWRGQGYGWRIWQAAMNQLGARTIGLDGVIDQQENYRRSGFSLAHRNIRHGGQVDCARPTDPRLVPIETHMIPIIARHDRAFVATARDSFCAAWLDPSIDTRKSLALDRDGHIEGYGTIRQCHEGWKIGPLFARTGKDADTLFQGLCESVGTARVFLDTPEPNSAALALAERHGLTPVFETARMYRGTAPDLPLNRIYGVTSFELG